MPIIFGGIRTAVLDAIKAQLPFSEGKYQLLNSWNKIPFPISIICIFSYRIRTDQIILACKNIPAKTIKRYEKADDCILSLFPIFFRWVPLAPLEQAPLRCQVN